MQMEFITMLARSMRSNKLYKEYNVKYTIQ